MRNMYCLLAMTVVLFWWPQPAMPGQWVGDHASLHVNDVDHLNQPRDPEVMQRILEFVDGSFEYYAEVTGVSKGHVTITMADLEGRAGALAYIGGTEIWIDKHQFDVLYAGAASADERYDQTLAYELGRVFYHFEGSLGEEFATAFAILMRFAAMEEIGVKGNVLYSRPFADFQAGWAAFETLFSESGASARIMTNDEALRRLDGNDLNLGSGDLLASIVWHFACDYEDSGGEGGKKAFLTRFFERATQLNRSRGAWYQNLVLCAEHGAQRSLRQEFRQRWRWPIR